MTNYKVSKLMNIAIRYLFVDRILLHSFPFFHLYLATLTVSGTLPILVGHIIVYSKFVNLNFHKNHYYKNFSLELAENVYRW